MRSSPIFTSEYELVGTKPYRLKWDDVLKIWRANEENLEHWIKYYQKEGYKSWEEWREKFFKRFGVRHLAWDFFEMKNQIQVMTGLRGANFGGWRRLMEGQKHLTFLEMAKIEAVQTHPALKGFMENFPKETTIIAVRHRGEIYVIEGMHRCAAYSVALSRGKVIDSKIKIALGHRDGLRPLFLDYRL